MKKSRYSSQGTFGTVNYYDANEKKWVRATRDFSDGTITMSEYDTKDIMKSL